MIVVVKSCLFVLLVCTVHVQQARSSSNAGGRKKSQSTSSSNANSPSRFHYHRVGGELRLNKQASIESRRKGQNNPPLSPPINAFSLLSVPNSLRPSKSSPSQSSPPFQLDQPQQHQDSRFMDRTNMVLKIKKGGSDSKGGGGSKSGDPLAAVGNAVKSAKSAAKSAVGAVKSAAKSAASAVSSAASGIGGGIMGALTGGGGGILAGLPTLPFDCAGGGQPAIPGVGPPTFSDKQACVGCKFVWGRINAEVRAAPQGSLTPDIVGQSFDNICADSPDVFYQGCDDMYDQVGFMIKDSMNGASVDQVCGCAKICAMNTLSGGLGSKAGRR